MEPNQEGLVAFAVPRDLQKIVNAVESRLAGQIVRDVVDGNRRNRIDDDVSILHRVAAAHLHLEPRPDADAASDSPAPDPPAKPFGEHHDALAPSPDEYQLAPGPRYLISYEINTTRSSAPTCLRLCELPGRVNTAVPGAISTAVSSTVMTPLPLST